MEEPEITMSMKFSTVERRTLAVLINNFSIFGSQLIARSGIDFSSRALRHLTAVYKDQPELIKRLDLLAREQKDESPSRLIEDLALVPSDMAQLSLLVRRCLLVSAFLGHCLAQPTAEDIADGESTSPITQVH